MENRWIKAGGLAVVVVVLVLIIAAVNPFRGDDHSEIGNGEFHEVPSESDVNDESVNVPSPDENENTPIQTANAVVMFHNGTGPMCIDALDFFEEHELQVEEYLTTDVDFSSELAAYSEEYSGVSEGVSRSFGYYPIIFVGGRAFSGFDTGIGQEILELVGSAE